MSKLYIFVSFIYFFGFVLGDGDDGVMYPTQCEVCKYLAVELEEKLKDTGKSHEVLELGYQLDDSKKRRIPYKTSELRLEESLESVCERILEYNIHKERKDSTRFAKGMSQTFQTLHGLVNKGVKVELGIPYELWDKPSVEVTTMKSQCEFLLEKHEADIEDWYFNHQEVSLQKFLCIDKALRKGDTECLGEALPIKSEKKKSKKKSKSKDSKSSTGTKSENNVEEKTAKDEL